jgi:type I restriction enzyme, S subunit
MGKQPTQKREGTQIESDNQLPEGILLNDGLPEGWAFTRMATIANVVGGGTPEASSPRNFADAGHPWITPADLSGFRDLYITKGKRDLSDAGLRSCSATMMPAGTVLMSSRAPIGYLAIARNPVCTNQGFKSFVCHPDIAPEFVYLWLKLLEPQLESMGSGSTFLEISGSRAKQIPILLAPMAEQRRIAAQIVRALPGINSAYDHLSRVPVILKHFRQSVLAAACSGNLTADWRSHNTPRTTAEDFLRGILAKRTDRAREYGIRLISEPAKTDDSQLSDVPESWTIANLDQLSCFVTSGSRGWAKYYADSGPLFIRAQDINTDRLQSDGIAHVRPPKNAEGMRTRVCAGDLLITITGANVTKSALVDREIGEAYVSQHVALVRLVDPAVGPFLYLWTISPVHGRAKLLDDAYGAGKPGLNLDNIKGMALALPSPDEQSEIVHRVKVLFSLADVIETHVSKADRAADKLSESLLARAFRGELVPTEAELARREGRDYEPASVLLERIRAERDDHKTPPAPKRRLQKANAQVGA